MSPKGRSAEPRCIGRNNIQKAARKSPGVLDELKSVFQKAALRSPGVLDKQNYKSSRRPFSNEPRCTGQKKTILAAQVQSPS